MLVDVQLACRCRAASLISSSRRIEPVDVGERRVRIEKVAFDRRAENAFDGVVEQPVITAFGFAQRLLGVSTLGDVLDQAFERDRPAVLIVHADAAFPHPARAAVGVQDAVFEVERIGLGRPRSGWPRAPTAGLRDE